MECLFDQNDVLSDFTIRLNKLGIEYMLTGSMAMAHYAIPRSTADIDIVVNFPAGSIEAFIAEFGTDYYIPEGRARDSVNSKRLFNLIHQDSVLKIDCIPLKSDRFQKAAFERRKNINYSGDFEVTIITKEDLILSKLLWAKETGSEMQMRDVANLLRNDFDREYVSEWSKSLLVSELLSDCRRMLEDDNAE